MAPSGLEVTRVEIDPRVGGHYRVWEADGDSDVGGFARAFRDHGNPRRLRLVGCRETTTGAILATYARTRD